MTHRAVWKYPVEGVHRVPIIHKILTAGPDPQGVLCAWIEVEIDAPQEEFIFQTVGTGHPIPMGAVHVKSYLEGPFVWHIYMRRNV